MTRQYKYILQKGSLKYFCPECNKKTFVHYVDSVTGECLPSQYGRCDRESKCGYQNRHQYEKDNEFKSYKVFVSKPKPQQLVPIPIEVLGETLTDYENNTFIQNLLRSVAFPFESVDIENVIAQYYLGTVANVAVSFPFIDIQNNIRAIQVKQFDQNNHTIKTSFLHSIIKHQHEQKGEVLPDWLPAYELNELKVSCLFGEHLLNKYPLNPVALVEAPKSAIYGTLYFGLPVVPKQLLWLAVYNLSSLNVDKCKALKGREVFLFPDLSNDGKAFELWSTKAKELNLKIQDAKFVVSDLLETRANEAERLKGCDIADYLICQDWRLFRGSVEHVKSEADNKQNLLPIEKQKELPSAKSVISEPESKHFFSEPYYSVRALIRAPAQTNWTIEIKELETYFAAVEIPAQPIMLNRFSIITNIPLFIESHLSIVKAQNGRTLYLPYLNRLQEFKQYLNN